MKEILVVIVIVWLLIVGSIFYVIATTDHDAELVKDLKYSACVDAMTEAIPDPNDTDARVVFLKNCYEN